MLAHADCVFMLAMLAVLAIVGHAGYAGYVGYVGYVGYALVMRYVFCNRMCMNFATLTSTILIIFIVAT